MFVGSDNDSVNEDVGIKNRSDLEGEELSLAGDAYSIRMFYPWGSISYLLQLLSDLGQKPYPDFRRSPLSSHKQLHIFQLFKPPLTP